MTVTLIQKTKGSVQAQEKSELDQKVERLITLKIEIDAVKSQTAEYEKLRKDLAKTADGISAANEQAVFSSELGEIAFSPKSMERSISDMKKVFDLLGEETFLKIAKVTLGDLDKYLSKGEVDGVTTEALTGARKISVIAKEKEITQV